MPIRNLAEFLEARKADRRAQGFDDSTITELVEENPDSSGTTTYSVVMIPRRPKRKGEAPQG
jgi:hypothetical protein